MTSIQADLRECDLNNNLIRYTDRRGQVSTFDYDELDRLILESYANGQRISNRLDNGQVQITPTSNSEIDLISSPLKTQAELSYSYDLNGNRLTETGPDGTINYQWDARNRLVAIDKPNGQRHDFVYDFSGNMIRHDITKAGVTTRQHYVLGMGTQ